MNYKEIESEYRIKREAILAALEYIAAFVRGEEIRPVEIIYHF